jgi:GNAT superfamily N-acetyltransferase
MQTIAIDLNGYTDLPRGKIANVVTYLERREPVARTPPAEFAGLAVRHVVRPATGWYRDLYRRIGEQWLWFSRSIIPDLELSRILTDPMTRVLALERDGHALGLAELASAVSQEVEIAMFGVVSEVSGTGAAGFLMDHALSQAFASGARRIWLHTCTWDHPAAIPFYLRHGFSAYKYAIEVSDDPRLTGHLPETAARHVPLIRS